MPDAHGYPTIDELDIVRNWLYTEWDKLPGFLKEIWWHGDTGVHIRGRVFALHTWGWSGNEDIIGALQDNIVFWSGCWQKSFRGGHFWFAIPDLKK